MKIEQCPKSDEQGVALVVTMIVVAVMAVVAAAFMQGAGGDRAAANSLVANYQARLAADAGAQCAWGLVRDSVCFGGSATNTNPAFGYHDSVTVWQNIGGAATNEATVLYVRAKTSDTNQGARPGEFGADVTILARPLVSGGSYMPLSAIGTNMPYDTNNTNLMREMVNLNGTNELNPSPWIGYRSAPVAGAPVTAARWIYVSRDGGPTNTTNPAIARYAYWLEDESFKVNLNVVTNGVRGTNAGTSPQQASIDGVLGASANLRVYTNKTTQLLQDRATLGSGGFTDRGSAALGLGLEGVTNAAEFRFLTTVNSAGLDLSRGGFKRFNINSVTNGITGPADAANIRTSLNRIVAAITNSNSVPNFGQRFYRLASSIAGINASNAVTAGHAAIYLNKVAANVLDYVDADDQPTVLSNDAAFTPVTGRPTNAIYAQGGNTDGINSVAAMGVENLPRLQEYAFHARLRSMRYDTNNPDSFGFDSTNAALDPKPSSADYEIWIDHYFEFWNPGTRDITLTNAFLQIDKSPAFPNAGGALAKERSITNIPVNATFPAGQITVLTTAPLLEVNTGLLPVGVNAVYLSVPDADRKFTGKTASVTNYSYFGYDSLFYVSMEPGPKTKGAVFLGNENGFLESFVGLPVFALGSTNAVGMTLCVSNDAIRSGLTSLAAGDTNNARGGSLRGNSSNSVFGAPFSTEGDPRALNEQLEFRNFTVTDDFDQTRFFITITNSPAEKNSTFGLPNTNFVKASNWVDLTSLAPGASNAPLFVRNGPFQTIGELGHLTDPARVPGTNGSLTNVAFSRGGGRTLRIGQSELSRWYDGNQLNASRTWTSWRLADFFTTTGALSIPGQINPNGVLRDGGAAFRAALHGLTYLPTPEGVAGLAGLQLNATRLNLVASSLNAYLTNASDAGLPSGALNALWERGEISELPIFNSGSVPTTMSNKFDRGREELVRRSIEMITTRGSVFTVYVIGQALQVTPQTTNVIGSARLKQTFEISPQYSTTDSFNDSFNPAQAVRVSRRFSTPTNYTYRIISSSYD